MDSKRLVICTSTGCIEYAPERYHNLGIEIIRINFFFKDKEYKEGLDLDPVSLYKQMENVKDVKDCLPHTAIPSYEEISQKFIDAIDKGYEEIFVICISSGLGGTYNFIRLVAEDYQDQIKINVIDAKTTCFQEGLMAIKVKELADKGVPTETILKEVEWIKAHHEFIGIDARLDYLILNRRLKGGKAYLGKMMRITPVIHFSREGEIVPLFNTIGSKKALAKTCEELLKIIGKRDPKDYILFHIYTGDSTIKDLIEIEKKYGIKTNHEDVIMSPVSGCHNGPWLAAYAYEPIRRDDEPLGE